MRYVYRCDVLLDWTYNFPIPDKTILGRNKKDIHQAIYYLFEALRFNPCPAE